MKLGVVFHRDGSRCEFWEYGFEDLTPINSETWRSCEPSDGFVYKLLLNSLYGKFAERYCMWVAVPESMLKPECGCDHRMALWIDSLVQNPVSG